MKRLPLITLVAALALMGAASACNGENDEDKIYNQYEQWYNFNKEWLAEQQARTNADGSPYFETVVAPWDPTAFVLLHYFNDRELTKNNLSPLYTSTIDTRYHVSLANGAPIDSSYNITSDGPGIFRTGLNEVIEGWAIAFEVMHVGDSVECIIPFQQAYGTTASGAVPPYSNLKYVMSLVDIYTYEVNPK